MDVETIISEPGSEGESTNTGPEVALGTAQPPTTARRNAGAVLGQAETMSAGSRGENSMAGIMRNPVQETALNVYDIVQTVVQIMEERQRTNARREGSPQN